MSTCAICGEPMPAGEEMFKYHGYSGPCPKPAPVAASPAVLAPVDVAERRAPVQGYAAGIPWSLHLEAYDAYCKRYGKQQALIEGSCRGGFGVGELDTFIPGWRNRVSEVGTLRAAVEQMAADLAAAREENALLRNGAEREQLNLSAQISALRQRAEAAEALLRDLRADMNAPSMHPLDFSFDIWTAAIDAALQEPRPHG